MYLKCCLGESLLLYTDINYNWLDSGFCGDQFYFMDWDVYVCVWEGVWG